MLTDTENAYVQYGIVGSRRHRSVILKVTRNRRRRWLMLHDSYIQRRWENTHPATIMHDIEMLLRRMSNNPPALEDYLAN